MMSFTGLKPIPKKHEKGIPGKKVNTNFLHLVVLKILDRRFRFRKIACSTPEETELAWVRARRSTTR